MKDYKIKYRLEELKGDGECWPLLFQVLEQDVELLNKLPVYSNLFCCRSSGSPYYTRDDVNIRGRYHNFDFGASLRNFELKSDREKVRSEIAKAIELYVNTHCKAEKLEAKEIEPHVYKIGGWITYRLQVIKCNSNAAVVYCVTDMDEKLRCKDMLISASIDNFCCTSGSYVEVRPSGISLRSRYKKYDNKICIYDDCSCIEAENIAKKAHAAILEYVRVNTQSQERKTVEIEKGVYCV